jgi:hypothetical protein
VRGQRAQAAPQQLFGAVADDDDLECERDVPISLAGLPAL